ncbi:hypothetical protein IFM61606_04042 [Aspergillus udagawae]|nr:hypothetical protein IFM61606_04042 [Aspergillus udagawae]
MILRDQKPNYFKGNLAAYEQDFESQKLYWGRMKEAEQRQIAHMEASIREIMKIGEKTNDDNKLRQAQSQQKKAEDRIGTQVNATSGRFKLIQDLAGFHLPSRAEIEVPQDEKGATISPPQATGLRFPGPLVSLEGITFQYRKNYRVILDDILHSITYGNRLYTAGPERLTESSPEQLKLMERNYTPFEPGSRTGIGRNISAGDVNVDSGFN